MIKIVVLGNNSAIPAYGRNPTAQVVEIHDQVFLMDCGEGTQQRLVENRIHWSKINHIFISHLHGDHYFGLIGLLSSMGLWSRTTTLHLYGPALLKEIIDLQINAVGGSLPFEIRFRAIAPDEADVLIDSEHYSVNCFPVQHGIPCHGFLFKEKNAGKKINAEACKQYGIPYSYYQKLKEGEHYITKSGEVIKNGWLTHEAPPEKAYAFCADTIYDPSMVIYIKNVDLLYHESTYLNNHLDKATARYHSTAEQAASIALQASVKKLLLGHYSSRYQYIQPFEEEAKRVFANTEASVEGRTYLVN